MEHSHDQPLLVFIAFQSTFFSRTSWRDVHSHQAHCTLHIMASTHLLRKALTVIDSDDDSLRIEELDSPPAYPKFESTELPYGDHFRLLELLTGGPQSSLRCRLPVFNLNTYNVPKYQARSYIWSESKNDRLIFAANAYPSTQSCVKSMPFDISYLVESLAFLYLLTDDRLSDVFAILHC